MEIRDILNNLESVIEDPEAGDGFFFEFDDTVIESTIVDVLDDGVVLEYSEQLDDLLSSFSVKLDEAEYQGRKVPLGKPMKGDVKKSKVYVKKPNGNVVKVNFGDKTMKIKKSNPNRRKSFRARHNCDNPGPKWKARYWSCRAW
jgi:hypothetical protein